MLVNRMWQQARGRIEKEHAYYFDAYTICWKLERFQHTLDLLSTAAAATVLEVVPVSDAKIGSANSCPYVAALFARSGDCIACRSADSNVGYFHIEDTADEAKRVGPHCSSNCLYVSSSPFEHRTEDSGILEFVHHASRSRKSAGRSVLSEIIYWSQIYVEIYRRK
jgi:hypothetical protein